jgi:cytochrome oxidase Cu insertion factor (SCO1/SenC/PrrC family)
MKGLVSIALGIGMLACAGAAAFVAVSHQGPTRSPGLENFHLVGPTGRSYSIESFRSGAVLAIYFGYTTCLGTCPTALNSIAEAIDRLGAAGDSVQPVFIDMDPEQAVLANIRLYMNSFGPSFLGLTGSSADVERAARSFKVRVERIQFSADRTDYAMKHTSPIFVMRANDPHPKLLPATSSPADIEAALRNAL